MVEEARKARLLEAAAAVLSGTPGGRLGAVLLNKALFYVDLMALRDFGQTVTRNEYLALPLGPVIMGYEKRLIRELDRADIATQGSDGLSKPISLTRPFSDFRHIAEHERDLGTRMGAAFAKKTAADISEYSHKNHGWDDAYRTGLDAGKPPSKIDMNVALQQMGGRDEWLNAPLSADELASVEAARHSGLLPW